MTKVVDSYRFISGITRRMLRTWVGMETPRSISWTPLKKPLSESSVALISSAGIALKNDLPFDQEGERNNPWWGDPSYRVLPKTTSSADVNLYHLHIDPRPAQEDLNCLFPLTRLMELERLGEIGASTEHHYSIMGYILKPETQLRETVPAIIRDLRADLADVVVLVPVWPICCWSVGLVQRKIEEAGFSTIILTPVPDVALSVCVPRIAAIEYPLGRTLGHPCDSSGQMAVLRATLAALESIQIPGGIVHLPFEWIEVSGDIAGEPPSPPPIVSHIIRHPWQLPRLLKRDVPE